MNILVIDAVPGCIDFCMRAMAQKHVVKLWTPIKLGKHNIYNGKGLVPKVHAWEPHMKWADLIVVSDNFYRMTTLDQYRSKGYPVFGPTKATAQWELDRCLGQAVLQNCGVPVADVLRFTSFRKAAQFVAGSNTRYVTKPNGGAGGARSYVSKSNIDLQCVLERCAKDNPGPTDIVLQEFIEGVEMAVGGFFGPGGWCGPWLENFEHKKLMAGDVGPNTGEMGTILKYVRKSRLAEEMLIPLSGELYRQGYTGYIDVACLIDKRGRPWPLEFTTRFGFPLWSIQQALHPDIAIWMGDLVRGVDTFNPSEEVASGIRVCLRDFPYMTAPTEDSCDYPIFGAATSPLPGLHLDDAMLGEALGKPQVVTAGPIPLVVSGVGRTIRMAADKMYKRVKDVNIPNSPLYRTDLGNGKMEEKLNTLQKLDYALGWRYD